MYYLHMNVCMYVSIIVDPMFVRVVPNWHANCLRSGAAFFVSPIG